MLLDVTDIGVLLQRCRSRLTLTASSSGDMQVVELLEVDLDEGPCFDAHEQVRAVIESDLKAHLGRWPQFAPRAVELGCRSVYAFPLRVNDAAIGAMNIFSDQPEALASQTQGIAQGLADFAAPGVRLSTHILQREQLAEQLQSALDSRIIVEQAKGKIAAQADVSIGDAFTLLRRTARNQGRTLHEIVTKVTSGGLTAADLSGVDSAVPTAS